MTLNLFTFLSFVICNLIGQCNYWSFCIDIASVYSVLQRFVPLVFVDTLALPLWFLLSRLLSRFRCAILTVKFTNRTISSKTKLSVFKEGQRKNNKFFIFLITMTKNGYNNQHHIVQYIRRLLILSCITKHTYIHTFNIRRMFRITVDGSVKICTKGDNSNKTQ